MKPAATIDGSADPRLLLRPLLEGRIVELTLAAPPGNVLDLALVKALRAALQSAPVRAAHAIVLRSAGAHFSYGASIEDHLPERIAPFLREFHGLAREQLSEGTPLVAAVQGLCLGGGLELALLAQRIVAAPGAELGCPEIKLGVFAPLASLLLPARIGQAGASDLLLTGRRVAASEALALRLVDEVADDPAAAAQAWIEHHWLGHSRTSLRLATAAAQLALAAEVTARLPAIEALYLERLMKTPDAVEGVRAFLEKRTARFTG